jgi:hypothetical protein
VIGDVGNRQLGRPGRGERPSYQSGPASGPAPGSVVRGGIARVMPRSPAVCISRDTGQRGTRRPCRCSSVRTIAHSVQARLSVCIRSMTAVVAPSVTDRADGGRDFCA